MISWGKLISTLSLTISYVIDLVRKVEASVILIDLLQPSVVNLGLVIFGVIVANSIWSSNMQYI